MAKWHEVRDARIVDDFLMLNIDGRPMRFAIRELSPRLKTASAESLAVFEVSPSGYGIHWPLIDEDLSIDGLLGIRHSFDTERVAA
ncbi:DUF2442 domain-containing protein [Sulfuricystis multivorans]|uniref:DUF2442 domain-containing protein n=1 Tax=Sulfuricystis multivorans TaxID=2211108 RepID=UPI000F83AD67|nr:DUF2442 domain-containing protein [Sulfuricystis multivorans]